MEMYLNNKQLNELIDAQMKFALEFNSRELYSGVTMGKTHPLLEFIDDFYIEELKYRLTKIEPQKIECPKCKNLICTITEGTAKMGIICPYCQTNLILESFESKTDLYDIRRYNTCFKGFYIIKEKDSSFFDYIKDTLATGGTKKANKVNYANILGALGEMRCYGYILDAIEKYNSRYNNENIQVSHIKTKRDSKTPDFALFCNGERVDIEVYTMNPSDDYWESKRIAAETQKKAFEAEKARWKASDPVKRSRNIISICESESSPYSKKDKLGRTVPVTVEEQISKLTNIKKGNLQADENSPFIIWIDLQDDNFWGDEETTFNPDAVQIFKGIEQIDFLSSAIWYAMYGKKGMRIFQFSSNQKDYDKRQEETKTMKHDGKFFDHENNCNSVSAIITSTPNYTFMLENLNASKPLPEWFFPLFRNVHNCDLGRCIIGEKSDLQEKISSDTNLIKVLSGIKLFTR